MMQNMSFDTNSFSLTLTHVSQRLVSCLGLRGLIDKLFKLGFSGPLLEWIRSYLVERKLRVRFEGEISREFIATSGVPAGTHGGPDLFLIMINDLPDVLESSKSSMYAEDCKVFKIITTPGDAELLQKDVENFGNWCKDNELDVNAEKCSSITFTRRKFQSERVYSLNGSELENVTSVRDLGVVLDSNMNFSSHIGQITSTAMKVLGFVRRFSSDFKDLSVLKRLYCALVRPHLEYCSVVWSPFMAEDIKRIESVQRKFTKYAYKKMVPQRELTYENRCAYLGLETLESRREKAGQIFVAGLISGSIDCSQLLTKMCLQVPRESSRTTSLIKEIEIHRTDYGKNNPVSRIIRNFNRAQEVFDFNLSKESFKSRLRSNL
jgi:ribonucleases P/MRP protein subunit RPP40